MPTGLTQNSLDFDFRPYVRVLSRRKWIIILITLLATGSAFYLSNLQAPKYRSTAELLFKSSAADLLSQGPANAPVSGVRALASEAKLLGGQAVRTRVAERIGTAPPVAVSVQDQESVISVSAESSDRTQAANIANSYAQAYIDHRRDSTINEVLAAQKAIQAKIDQVRNQLDEKTRQIAGAPKDVSAGLESERQALLSQEFGFRQQISQLQFRADLSGGGVEIVTEAQPASAPFEPTPKRAGLLAGSLGLMAALGLAFFVDFLDDSIQNKEDVERAAPGIPVIGSIPAVARNKQAQVLSVDEPMSQFAEAFRNLRTSIQFMSLDQPVRMLQVTSPSAGEGKSTLVSNLAVAFARAGRRVVLVDSDLRRPRLSELFNLPAGRGFTSVLLKENAIGSAISDGPIGNLKVLPSGPLPPNPSELLSSRIAAETLVALKAQCDFVLVDSAPVLPVSDAAILSKLVDGTICVVSVGQTTRRQLHRTVEILGRLNTKLIGIVLNGVTERSSGYATEYGYGYESRSAPEQESGSLGGRRSESRTPTRPSDPSAEKGTIRVANVDRVLFGGDKRSGGEGGSELGRRA